MDNNHPLVFDDGHIRDLLEEPIPMEKKLKLLKRK
jgi:hypothetical protein